ncbi:MAG: aminotransferase class I/II-fold pyridoxal phosphate-dependent enzyme [Chloroflexota bacterium]|nr:aminotransferase class I/II-fold pyridoxal phosphate-dependent enzyme [Chloroflexota bacterium]
MVAASRVTDGRQYVAERARIWLTDDAPASVTPTLPVIDLGMGELDRRTAPHIIAAVAEALDRGATHYTDRPGIAPLRYALADRLAAESGVVYDPHREILISSGGQEGLFVAAQMLVRPGDEVLLADPGYPTYNDAVRLAGGVCVPVPVDPAAGVGLTAAAIEAHLTPRTRLLILVSPDNPTGAVIGREEMAKIAALAVKRDFLVLFDEIYKAFVFDGAAHSNIAACPGMRARTVVVGSFSKEYAMTGWRVGYVAGEAHLIQPITDLKLALSICSAAPSQWAALAALTGPQDAVTEMRDDLAERRAVLLPALAAMGLPHGNPRGAYYAFVDIRSTGRSSAGCARIFHERAGVRTLPGHLFGPGGEGYLRVSLAQPAPAIRDAMTRLAPLVYDLQEHGE